MIATYAGILAGLILLVYGANLFIDGAAGIAVHLGISPLIIGLTIVGMATSAPEILVGMVAALNGKTEIAIGNALGSNIANMSLVLGFTAMLIPITITSQTLKHEFYIMMIAAVLALLLMLDQNIGKMDAGILLTATILTLFAIVRLSGKNRADEPLTEEFKSETSVYQDSGIGKLTGLFIIGLILLLGGSNLLVECSVIIAKYYGMSDLLIGLTIIAVGTSLPELAASITAARKNEADIMVGNIIGSNIFNIFAVIGLSALIHPTNFDRLVLTRDLPCVIGLSLLMGWMIFIYNSGKFSRWEGFLLFLSFITYQYYLFNG